MVRCYEPHVHGALEPSVGGPGCHTAQLIPLASIMTPDDGNSIWNRLILNSRLNALETASNDPRIDGSSAAGHRLLVSSRKEGWDVEEVTRGALGHFESTFPFCNRNRNAILSQSHRTMSVAVLSCLVMWKPEGGRSLCKCHSVVV